MPASKNNCTRGCKLTERSMGHCGHKNCPGLGVLDRVYTTRGSRVMKKKATEKKTKRKKNAKQKKNTNNNKKKKKAKNK